MEIHKKTLPNKMRIVSAPVSGTESLTVLVLFGVGSRYETASERGVSHFLEHMFFKGTQKRQTAAEIAGLIDGVGGYLNAFTEKHDTGYYCKVSARHLDLALDVIADALLHSKFEQGEVDKEVGAVLEEMKMYFDQPMAYIPELFESLLYGNHPLGWDTIGTEQTLKSMKRDDFLDYIKRFYTPDNAVIVVAGAINPEEVEKKVEQYFQFEGRKKAAGFLPAKYHQTKPQILLQEKDTEQTHLVLGTRAYEIKHPNERALQVLSQILGGPMSSRLFIAVRENQGLAYHISSYIQQYEDAGHLMIHSGVNIEKTEQAIESVLQEMRRLKTEPVPEDELSRIKEYIKGKTALRMEDSEAVANYAAVQEMFRGNVRPLKEYFAEIDAVTSEDIIAVAHELFIDKNLNLAVIGPFSNEAKFAKILRF